MSSPNIYTRSSRSKPTTSSSTDTSISTASASTSNASNASASTSSSHSHSLAAGIRAQLHHLLPRHALFHVHLAVHQIDSIPLLHGDFAVRWKFKNVRGTPTQSSRSSLLRRFRGQGKGKGKEREKDDEHDEDGRDSSPAYSTLSSSGEDNHSLSAPSSHGHGQGQGHRPTSSFPNPQHDWLPDMVSHHLHPQRHSHHQQGSSPIPPKSPSPALTPSSRSRRGITPFVRLKDHSVTWEHTVSVVVQLDVDRDTSMLQPNELKLVVTQKVTPGDPDAPTQPRLGVLSLDLATYATPSLGAVTRRYLLRESRTNATLKLTLQVTPLPGTPSFVAPPLEKGGVGAGLDVGAFLGLAGRMRELDFLGMPSGSSVLSGSSSPPTTTSSPSRMSSSSAIGSLGAAAAAAAALAGLATGTVVPRDVEWLPFVYGPRTTETLIDAIFNPLVVDSPPARTPRGVQPFVQYLGEQENDDGSEDESETESRNSTSTCASSADTFESAVSSFTGMRTLEEETEMSGSGWWKRFLVEDGRELGLDLDKELDLDLSGEKREEMLTPIPLPVSVRN